MIFEYIRYDITDGSETAFEAAYVQAGESLAAAPECRGWDMARSVDEPNRYILRIEWDSAEAHMDGFRKGPHFPPFFRAIRPWVGMIAEMRHYAPTTVAGRSLVRSDE